VAITVRHATDADLASLLALYGQLNPDDPPLAAETALQAWREVAAQPGRTVLVAELEGEVVGTADCAEMANLTRGARPWLLVENVVVDAGHRRRGIGASLLDAAVSLARSAGCYELQLVSRHDRTEAHALYESRGLSAAARGYRRYFDMP
jgi:ribosomal protein S18 acetylase RimI-like enzyme